MSSQEEFKKIIAPVKDIRLRLMVKQAYAGNVIGCNQSQYSKKERGLQDFTLRELEALSKAFKVPLKKLLKTKD